MRPTRGRPPTNVVPNTRAKPCFVRLEKVTAKEDKDEDENKKLTGPIKKRPVVIKRGAAGRPSKKSVIEEDLSSYNLVTARSRRTPKPNPKYSKDHIVETTFKSKERGDSMAEDSDELPDDEDIIASSDVEGQLSDEEESSEDERRTRAMAKLRKASPLIRKRGPGRPPRKQSPDMDKAKIIIDQTRKRKIEWDKSRDEASSIIARNKRLNIELYDASDTDVPTMSPGGRRGRPSLRSVASSSKTPEPMLKKIFQHKTEVGKKYGSSPKPLLNDSEEDFSQHRSDDDDDDNEVEIATGTASTIDDFETMPTFTIVNINDIINKKGDVLTNKPTIEEDSNPSAQISRNRRKTMHTTILSDKIDQSKLVPPPRSPFPPRKPTTTLSTFNNNSLSKSLISSSSVDGVKTAPRILNSVVAKKTKPVTPLVSKVATKISEPTRSKENVHVNTSGQPSSTIRKLPSEKVLVQRQGNKLIKKITCFETWYVINIPPHEPPVPKNILEMSLTELGSRASETNLPSESWNYKITLQKLTEVQLAKGNHEKFTGNINDSNISDSEKQNYQPVSVMFRRTNKNSRLRMPFDRAVIFKNKTYFINIDGKNVRLLGAPQTIRSISDIEILLEVVNEVGLGNQFVEQTNFIL